MNRGVLTPLGSTCLWTVVPVTDKPSGSRAHLGVLEDVHDEDGEAQAKDVGCEAGVEVGMGVLLQASGKAWEERGELV